MNCTDIKIYKNEYFEGQLTLLQQRAFDQHLGECRSCKHLIGDIKKTHQALYHMVVPEPDRRFIKSIFSEVRKQYPEERKVTFNTMLVSAVAVSVMLWLASTLIFSNEQLLIPAEKMQMTLNSEETIRLMFDAGKDIELVTMHIELPQHIELLGHRGKTGVTLQTNLIKGKNLLRLPVKAVAHGKGVLVAELNYGNKMQKFNILIKTSGDGVVNYKLQLLKPV